MNVAVVGGGLGGLVAAYHLASAGIHPTVLERSTRWGGQVWTTSADGFLIEYGAEGYAAGRSAARELCDELGLTDRLVSQSAWGAFELNSSRLVPTSRSRAAELAGIQADRSDIGQGITSFRGGMGELVDVLRVALASRSDLRVSTEVRWIEPQAGGWVIGAGDDSLRADAVVLATPAADAARLLAPTARAAADMVAAFRVVSTVTVSLAFERSAVRHPLDGSGFVSGAGPEAEGFRACTFSSSQFPDRAPPGRLLLRAFFRPGPHHPLEAPDERWVDIALGVLRAVVGIRGDPAGVWVARWPDALPRYAPGHDAQVLAVSRQASRNGAPLALAGAAYQRAGVAGAIEAAQAAARHIRHSVRG